MKTSSAHGQSISLRNISKSWDDIPAVRDISIDVDPGTFTVLLGPSGCGKSTTLRIIAGLEYADSGEVVIGEQDVSRRPPSERNIAMVFQSYALFPHLSVAENILFGLKVRRTAKSAQRARLAATADMLGLTDYLARKPAQLSGGQQQRVALGRAIIAEKPICLMDEPLSNLDAKLRNTMRAEIRELQQSLGFTMVYVTHDQSEAITMADQVVLMRHGRIEQAGAPRDIYQHPASQFVASFIGTPPMNLLPVQVLNAHLDQTNNNVRDEMNAKLGAGDVVVGIRPEDIQLRNGDGVPTHVHSVEYLGADTLAECVIGDTKLLVRVDGSAQMAAGDSIQLNWDAQDMHFFDQTSGLRVERSPYTATNKSEIRRS